MNPMNPLCDRPDQPPPPPPPTPSPPPPVEAVQEDSGQALLLVLSLVALLAVCVAYYFFCFEPKRARLALDNQEGKQEGTQEGNAPSERNVPSSADSVVQGSAATRQHSFTNNSRQDSFNNNRGSKKNLLALVSTIKESPAALNRSSSTRGSGDVGGSGAWATSRNQTCRNQTCRNQRAVATEAEVFSALVTLTLTLTLTAARTQHCPLGSHATLACIAPNTSGGAAARTQHCLHATLACTTPDTSGGYGSNPALPPCHARLHHPFHLR